MMEPPVFDERSGEYRTRLSPPQAGEGLVLRILLGDWENCAAARLIVWEDGGPERAIPMRPGERTDSARTFWQAEFTPAHAGLYWYCFEFDGNFRRQRVTRAALGRGVIGAAEAGGEPFQLTVYEPDFSTPDWVRGGLIYQIFPDRFRASGAPKRDVPADRFLVSDWDAQPAFRQDGQSRRLGNDYYGGDLRGIAERLDHLAGLGVSLIYLNPIFEAHSNHRYDTADYFKIDPLLGTLEDFRALCAAARARGMRVLLDGVFSHTGADSVYFNKAGRYPVVGAYQSPQSPYAGWFKFSRRPDQYESWWGVPSLPETREDDPGFMEFICGENGVLRYWLRQGASGWRLDVADELPDCFLERARAAVKAENPQALLLGEVWEDASNKISYGARRKFLLGRQLDSVMNYPLRDAILAFVMGGDAWRLEDCVRTLLSHYPKPCVDALMNHIGTHDTARALTVLGGAPQAHHDREWQARETMTAEQLARGRTRLRLAAVLQYTLPGVPSLYYGDEAGMTGYSDPFNRAGYPWGREDAALPDFYRALGTLRRACPAFAGGTFEPVCAELGHIAYLRRNGDDAVLVGVNRWCDEARVPLPAGWESARAVWGAPPEGGTLVLPAEGVAVLGLGGWTERLPAQSGAEASPFGRR